MCDLMQPAAKISH